MGTFAMQATLPRETEATGNESEAGPVILSVQGNLSIALRVGEDRFGQSPSRPRLFLSVFVEDQH